LLGFKLNPCPIVSRVASVLPDVYIGSKFVVHNNGLLYIDNQLCGALLIRTPSILRSRTRSGASAVRRREVPAVSRAIAILRLLGKSEEPLGVNAIARELRIVPSTCLHILRVLVREELVAFNPATKRYRLEAGILTIARSFMRRNTFGGIVQPILDWMSDEYGVTAIGVQVIGLDHVVALALSHSDLPLQIHVEIGSRFPALISATGCCLAAFGGYSWSELQRPFRALRWHRAPSVEKWRAEIEAARQSGYSIDEGDYMQGITIVAVPILNQRGLMTHGIVAVGVSQQMEKIGTVALATRMCSLAAGMSERLDSG
jgi:DNA-binding IclR family transcriptional regulator